jgi:hypothetical protein
MSGPAGNKRVVQHLPKHKREGTKAADARSGSRGAGRGILSAHGPETARRLVELRARRRRTQPNHLRWYRRQWLPPGDRPDMLPGFGVVSDATKPPAQLDGGRQLTLLFIDSADRGGVGFGYEEHRKSMVVWRAGGKLRVGGNDIRRTTRF